MASTEHHMNRYVIAVAATRSATGVFEPVPKHATTWIYKTVSQSGDMWGLRFEFQQPPETLETFVRDGKMLRARGAGPVTVCGFTAQLPFDRRCP
jgi:hypothetical protein